MNNIKKKIVEKKKTILIVLLVLPLTVLLLITLKSGYAQIKEMNSLKEEMVTIGENIHITYHREIRLIEDLDILDTQNYNQECEEYTKHCLYLGSEIRRQFLSQLEKENFSDNQVEILNMISSIDENIRRESEQYDELVEEYNRIVQTKPISLSKLLLPSYNYLLR